MEFSRVLFRSNKLDGAQQPRRLPLFPDAAARRERGDAALHGAAVDPHVGDPVQVQRDAGVVRALGAGGKLVARGPRRLELLHVALFHGEYLPARADAGPARLTSRPRTGGIERRSRVVAAPAAV